MTADEQTNTHFASLKNTDLAIPWLSSSYGQGFTAWLGN